MEIFKVYLPAVRVNTGMSQKEWANALGVSPDTVVNWEMGKTSPNVIKLRRMSELSGIPMDFIFLPDKYDNIVSKK